VPFEIICNFILADLVGIFEKWYENGEYHQSW